MPVPAESIFESAKVVYDRPGARVPLRAMGAVDYELLDYADIDAAMADEVGWAEQGYLTVSGEPEFDSPHDLDESISVVSEAYADLAFLEVKDELATRIHELGPKLCTNYTSEDYPEIFERERAFFVELVAETLAMAERHSGPVAVLLDSDYTIVHADAFVARPALGLALRELHGRLGQRLSVGLNTTRPMVSADPSVRAGLNDELQNPTYTKDFRQYIKTDFVVSSGDMERGNPAIRSLIASGDSYDQAMAAPNVLGQEKVAAALNGELDISRTFDAKLICLEQLLAQHPDTAFVMIDDFPYVNLIRNDSSRIRGVWVDNKVLDKLYRPFNTPNVPAGSSAK